MQWENDMVKKRYGQTAAGISHNFIWNNELAFLRKIFNFPFRSHWKSYFLTTDQHQSLDSVFSKMKLPNRPKSECKLWKFTMVQVCVMGESFSAPKKHGLKTTNHSQPGASLRAEHRAERDLAFNLPSCFHLLFWLSFIRKTKNAQLKNPTDLLHKNLMKPLANQHDLLNCMWNKHWGAALGCTV